MLSPIRGALSLANKVQLLFGVAVIFIVCATLILPWFRVLAIIDQAEYEATRQFARFWETRQFIDPSLNIGWYREPTDANANSTPAVTTLDSAPTGAPASGNPQPNNPSDGPANSGGNEPAPADPARPAAQQVTPVARPASLPHEVLGFWPIAEWNTRDFRSPFLHEARAALAAVPEAGEPPPREFRQAVWTDAGSARIYRLARTVTGPEAETQGIIIVERRSLTAAGQVFVNRLYIIIAGLVAATLAVGVFFFITRSIILSPVRSLRDTAELVRGGSMHIRSDIRTGDEFEQLAAAFNSMLEDIERQQGQLKRTNRTLDIQVNRLEEQNKQLNEMARLKGEFLANISHELRTPLNSIIGFAEILDEIADAEEQLLAEAPQPNPPSNPSPKQVAKRRRYINHIVTAGRRLLEMITELLTMARLEAGRIGVEIETVNPADMAEALRILVQPLADRHNIEVRLELETAAGAFTDEPARANLPNIETDAKKLHQILFNFLSNAAKFTPADGLIRIRVETATGPNRDQRIKLSVIDNGPGIDPALHAAVFEKFHQIDGGHTREHQQGTGLGLAISKEFADMIGGEITLDSAQGHGSAFAISVPLAFVPAETAMQDRSEDTTTDSDADPDAGTQPNIKATPDPVPDPLTSPTARPATQRGTGAGRSELWRE